MLMLNDHQIAPFRAKSLASFKLKLKMHLLETFPLIMERAEDSIQNNFVELAVNRAAEYGLHTVATVQVYTDHMIRLGAFWDIDPIYKSTSAHLVKENLNPIARMDLVHADTVSLSKKVFGPNQNTVYFFEAVARVVVWIDSVRVSKLSTKDISSLFKRLYPQKAEVIDEDAFFELVTRYKENVEQLDIASEPVKQLAIVAMWIGGIGFFDDPLLFFTNAFKKSPSSERDEIIESHLKDTIQFFIETEKANKAN